MKLTEDFAENAFGVRCFVGCTSGFNEEVREPLGEDAIDGRDYTGQFIRGPVELKFHDGEFEIVDRILFHNDKNCLQKGIKKNAGLK